MTEGAHLLKPYSSAWSTFGAAVEAEGVDGMDEVDDDDGAAGETGSTTWVATGAGATVGEGDASGVGVDALGCGAAAGDAGEEMAGGGGICECPLIAFWMRSSIWSSSTELLMKSVKSPFLIRYSAGTTMMGTIIFYEGRPGKEMLA